VTAAVGAARDVLQPLTLLKGVHATTSRFNPDYKGTIDVTANGWMTGDVSYKWFKHFCQTVTARPIILICDGHYSHLTYKTIKLVSLQII